ncbi:MAG: twin-arginine translocation signal domain-containing protein [Helicobacteraceae bacterium]|nr:twin-arginine translocation signal domain-containing protein [Helicobacteraceae bacterium]
MKQEANSRRKFLKNAATASVVLAGAGVALTGCGKKGSSENLVRGKSPKVEILYQKSKQWEAYYSVAK